MSYDIAEICLNGHISNGATRDQPGESKSFCDKCGEKTICQCVHCSKPIRGNSDDGFLYNVIREAPKYCEWCGAPYPWTSASIEAAHDLADIIDELTDEDRDILTENLKDIVRDTPRTQVAAIKIKRVLSGLSPHLIDAFRGILVNVASEPVVEMIWSKQ